MRYDFKKVQEKIEDLGLTLAQVSEMTNGEVHYSTISKAFERGTASQRVGKALTKAFHLPYRSILPARESAA